MSKFLNPLNLNTNNIKSLMNVNNLLNTSMTSTDLTPPSDQIYSRSQFNNTKQTPKTALNPPTTTSATELAMDGRMQRRKYVKCPLCDRRIIMSKMDQHYQDELAAYTSQMNVRLTRSNASSASASAGNIGGSGYSDGNRSKKARMVNAEESRHHTKVLDVLDKVQRSSGKRFSGKRQQNSSSSSSREEYTCCVCQEVVVGTLEDINAHVDQCLLSRNSQLEGEPDQQDEFEVYECGGLTRIKVMSGVEGSLQNLGFVTSKSEDVADELDVDGDDSDVYGQPQFTDTHVDANGNEEEEDLDVDVLGGNSSTLLLSHSTSSSNIESHLIQALKDRISQLEKKNHRPQCLICMDDYKKPLTSIICWHVHCEQCWMSTLAHKKLCPQCNVITTPKDLRKIFL